VWRTRRNLPVIETVTETAKDISKDISKDTDNATDNAAVWRNQLKATIIHKINRLHSIKHSIRDAISAAAFVLSSAQAISYERKNFPSCQPCEPVWTGRLFTSYGLPSLPSYGSSLPSLPSSGPSGSSGHSTYEEIFTSHEIAVQLQWIQTLVDF
jgi:uncharacterized protein (UPF0335 family)